jgi:hypothetical protein
VFTEEADSLRVIVARKLVGTCDSRAFQFAGGPHENSNPGIHRRDAVRAPLLKTKLWSSLALAAGLAALPALSATSSSAVILTPSVEPQVIIVETAPPPLRAEVMPGAREGYVWAPGYWNYDGTRYVWVDGRFLPDQAGAVYVAPRYEASNGRYAFYGERWSKDPSKPNPLGNATANPLRPSPGQ